MTMLKIMVFSLAAMLGIFSSPVVAEGGAYQIELIVFLQSMPNTEVFDQASSQIKWPSDLTELSAYNKPENTTLDDSYAALVKDSTYRPILYVAWVQPGEKGLSAPVDIQSADGKLNGYLQIQHDPGLQMTVDLELNANSGDGFSKSVVYRLNEKRAVKLNEVYYLDHPKFGGIVKIAPL
ncbi:CsiV family protein [Methylobacter sp.]|uniref:CsiV family protein n=1 Tax=Methylobacter sp. TaxID=2051955 RepID=UPI002FDD1299